MRQSRPLTAGARRAVGRGVLATRIEPRRLESVPHTVKLNRVVPKFKWFLVFHTVSAHRLALKGFLIDPFSLKLDSGPYGGCDLCKGHGSFYGLKKHQKGIQEKVKGHVYLTSKTRFYEAVTRDTEIGRYEAYGLKVKHGLPYPSIVAQGCLGADTVVSNTVFLDHLPLPKVPCSQRVPKTDRLSYSGPDELGPGRQETIYGHTDGARWLSVMLSHSNCYVNPQLERQRTTQFGYFLVAGTFDKTFTLNDTQPGYICLYLTLGGRFEKVPDGRISVEGELTYFAGDSLAISGPSSVPAGDTASYTFSGKATSSEGLYAFATTGACAATAQDEFKVHDGYDYAAVGPGDYSKTTPPITIDSSGNICAYLQSGKPSATAPTGETLLTASKAVTAT